MAYQTDVNWADEIPAGSVIHSGPSYEIGRYYDLFHKDRGSEGETPAMDYYYYDPVEHGWPSDKKYPLLVFLHGVSNALAGQVCISYTGAEFYASPEYQKDFGGAYILVPLANEYADEDGRAKGFWTEADVEPVYDLINSFIEKHTPGVAQKVVLGNSAGAFLGFRLVDAHTNFFNGLLAAATGGISDDYILDRYDRNNIHLLFAMGKRDEFHDFQREVEPRIQSLQKMKHCLLFTPEWVRNSDYSIASINFGIEMGQHCIMNSIHSNLMYDDGKPYDERLPRGVTGWLDEVFHS